MNRWKRREKQRVEDGILSISCNFVLESILHAINHAMVRRMKRKKSMPSFISIQSIRPLTHSIRIVSMHPYSFFSPSQHGILANLCFFMQFCISIMFTIGWIGLNCNRTTQLSQDQDTDWNSLIDGFSAYSQWYWLHLPHNIKRWKAPSCLRSLRGIVYLIHIHIVLFTI